MKNDPNVWAVMIAVITTFGGSKIWEVWQKKIEANSQNRTEEQKQEALYRGDLCKRIQDLETRLSESVIEREKLLKKITELSEELAGLRVKIEFMEMREQELNDRLSQNES